MSITNEGKNIIDLFKRLQLMEKLRKKDTSTTVLKKGKK